MPRKKLEILEGEGHEGLTSEYYIDSSSGEFRSIYTYNGEIVSRIKLKGKIVDRASALSLIGMDLKSARDWYRKALDILKENELMSKGKSFGGIEDLDLSSEVRALFVASVIFYGKAFAEAGGRKIKMEKNWLEKEFHERHDLLINYRNNFAAHSGDSNFESAETALLLFKKHGKYVYQPVTDRKQLSAVGVFDDDSDLIDLFDHVVSVVEGKYKQTMDRMGEYVMSKSHSFWLLAAGSNESINLDNYTKKK